MKYGSYSYSRRRHPSKVMIASCAVGAISLGTLLVWAMSRDDESSAGKEKQLRDLMVGTQDVLGDINAENAAGEILADSALVSRSQQDYLRKDKVKFEKPAAPVKTKVPERLITDANNPNKMDISQKPDGDSFEVEPNVPASDEPRMIGVGSKTTGKAEISTFAFSNKVNRRPRASSSIAGLSGIFQPADVASVQSMTAQDNTAHDYAAWAPKFMTNDLPDWLDGWKVTKTELISLDRFGAPRVYTGEKIPNVDQLKDLKIATRDARKSELAALKRLREQNEKIVIDRLGDSLGAAPTLVKAIHATENCRRCHQVREGELIGAFTFTLIPKKPARDLFDAPGVR